MIHLIDSNNFPLQKYFTLVRKLKSGSYGVVSLYQSIQNPICKYGIKTSNLNLAVFQNESRILRLLSPSRYFPRYFASFEESMGTVLYGHLIMQFIDGYSIAEVYRWNDYEAIDLCMIAAQLAYAIELMHRNGIIHRDLKMTNVMVERETLNVKVLDFGLSADLHSDAEQSMHPIIGTASYQAPEILNGGKYTNSIDWYAYGVILYRVFNMGDYSNRPFYERRNEIMKSWEHPVKTLIMHCTASAEKRVKSLQDVKSHKYFEAVQWDLLE